MVCLKSSVYCIFQLSVQHNLELRWFCVTDCSRKFTAPDDQSDGELKSVVNWLCITRFSLNFNWLVMIFSALIGFCNHFGFCFTTLN